MYNNIKEFREFIANATDEQIERAILYIHEVGILGGRGDIVEYNNHWLLNHSIKFANSDYEYTEDFLIVRTDVNMEDNQ